MPKISALTSLAQASVDTAADVLPIVDATAPATTKKVTVQAMVNAGLAAAAPQGGIFALTGALTVSGQSSFAAGSAAAPSVKVGAEQNGLYSSAANTLDVTLNGVRQAQFAYTASAVNFATLTGAVTTGSPVYGVAGSDTNIGAIYRTKGSGSHLFQTNTSLTQLEVAHAAGAVNYLTIKGAGTGVPVQLESNGSDAAIGFAFSAKGGSTFRFFTGGSFTNEQFRVAHTSSAVNYAQIAGSATGARPAFTAAGSDSNIGLQYHTKGAESHTFYTHAGSALQFVVTSTASAVNWLQATGGATGTGPLLFVGGSDTNINVRYRTQGTGEHRFETGSSGNNALVIAHTASAVNWPVVSGSATGNAVTISTGGSDANRSIAITPAGTGGVVVGTTTLTAGAVFEVRDSADGTNFIVGGSGTTNLLKVAAGSADAMALYANNTTEVLRLETAGGARLAAATAIPAGGTAGLGYMVSSSTNFGVFFGSGAPTLSAAKGSLYLRSDGTGTSDRAYINADGGTTWTALTTAA